MTVKQLIKQLRDCDPNAIVAVMTIEAHSEPIGEMSHIGFADLVSDDSLKTRQQALQKLSLRIGETEISSKDSFVVIY